MKIAELRCKDRGWPFPFLSGYLISAPDTFHLSHCFAADRATVSVAGVVNQADENNSDRNSSVTKDTVALSSLTRVRPMVQAY